MEEENYENENQETENSFDLFYSNELENLIDFYELLNNGYPYIFKSGQSYRFINLVLHLAFNVEKNFLLKKQNNKYTQNTQNIQDIQDIKDTFYMTEQFLKRYRLSLPKKLWIEFCR